MKKIIGLVSLLIVSVMLAACGSTTVTTTLDGDYVEYVEKSNKGNLLIGEQEYGLEISDNKGKDLYEDADFTIDTEKKVITYLNKEGFSQFNKEFTYTFENDVLAYDDKTYVKVGSDKYKEIQAEVEKNQGEK
ncbi:LptM family lipoprotein [Streptococcus sp. SS-4456]|uniref:LptM family lipoprotein n=1 Tax=Streptococcus sp. SS-4456 TaxID=3072286 RepID=UPI002FCC26DB